MSRRLISRSPDLLRLEEEGFHIEVLDEPALLIVRDVPYLTSDRSVREDGVLVSTLNLSNDTTIAPDVHTIEFAGLTPHDAEGRALNMVSSEGRRELGGGVVVDFQFSRKPYPPSEPPYSDYYQKVTTYVSILGAPVQVVDPSVTARTHPVIVEEADEPIFKYLENASTRAGIGHLTDKLRLDKVAIVGLGGTGSYVLDFLAKVPVREIHLFDGDTFYQHNAFRTPGAASCEDLEARIPKVDYLVGIYSRMRNGVIAHPGFLTEENCVDLRDMEFVFVCVDDGQAKRAIVQYLEEAEISFIEVGMGLSESDSGLSGIARTTLSTPSSRDGARRHISFSTGDAENAYVRNIQIAELNALNAAHAVIRWKKLMGFYADIEREQHDLYTVNDSHILREGAISP